MFMPVKDFDPTADTVSALTAGYAATGDLKGGERVTSRTKQSQKEVYPARGRLD